MVASVDRVMDFWLKAGVSGLIISAIATLAMISTRQPVRRLAIARWTLVALLCVPPLTFLDVGPTLSLTAPLRHFAPPLPSTAVGWSEDRDRGDFPYRRWLRPALLAGYASGLLWGFGTLVAGMVGAEWLRLRSEEAEPPVRTLRDEISRLAGIRPPDLRFSRWAPRPLLYGLRRPCIVLPHVFDRDEGSPTLRLVILHECCHLRGGDPCFSLLANVARIVWFPLPTVWWICAQMRLDQEFQADRLASQVFGPDFSYAKSLVELAEPGGATRRGGGGRALMPRVMMLVRCPFRVEPRPPLWWRASLIPGFALLTVLATSVSFVDAQPSDHTQPGPRPTDPGGTLFQLDRLTVAPELSSSIDQVTILPALLPSEFDLTLEVLTSLRELPLYRFAGYTIEPEAVRNDAGGEEQWFRVRIAQRGGTGSAWINDRSAPCRRRPGSRNDRLALRSPPQRAARYRSLTLSR